MADPAAAAQAQLRNIEAKTGLTLAALLAELAATGLEKTAERRRWLQERHGLGYGDANAVALQAAKAAAPPPAADPLDTLYAGPKAALRPLHEAVLRQVQALGPFEQAPKKDYVSLRRKKQFAMVGPATRQAIEIGLNARDLAPHPRLKLLPPGGMCQATTRVSSVEEVDAQLAGWLRQAFDAAG